MLLSLHIENIAVIRRADLDFSRGFTALTGETGAGKSIIIDSINLLLGAKADRELIRSGESYCAVSGLFSELSVKTHEAIAEAGLPMDEEGQLLIQRTVSVDGRSTVRINGRAVNLSVLKGIASGLIGIHGQSDTGALLEPSRHLELVDIYSDNAALLEKYKILYARLEGIRHKIEQIRAKESERERLKEILEYQIKDIDAYGLHDGEEEELVERKVQIKNSERIAKNSEFIYKALRGSEKGSVSYLLDRCATALDQLRGVVGQFDGYAERIRDVLSVTDDIAEEVYAVLEDMESDPTEKLNQIESRLDKISKLKRKYGLTVADVLAFRDRAEAELNTLENSEELLATLEKEERVAYDEALAIANELHSIRVTMAKDLEERVKTTLEFLDMPKVTFFASIKEEFDGERKILGPSGSDSLEFFISANRGAEAQSIAKIASGGELARIMLALKSVIADKDRTETVIFDEIDAGVSGKTARKIGIKMRELAENMQLLCVTHSAQIASVADEHFLISKSDIDGVTETAVNALDYDGRVAELSRILGGINVTDAQREAAVDMLKYKEG
ncbi:MAG: DNA repair protein RecN [Clostridia bacterium]|nr:DNA repair protein RecN [Clostridia bacterium]